MDAVTATYFKIKTCSVHDTDAVAHSPWLCDYSISSLYTTVLSHSHLDLIVASRSWRSAVPVPLTGPVRHRYPPRHQYEPAARLPRCMSFASFLLPARATADYSFKLADLFALRPFRVSTWISATASLPFHSNARSVKWSTVEPR